MYWGAVGSASSSGCRRLLRLWNQAEAESHLDQARQISTQLPANGNVFQTQFNRVNTTIHAVEISMELGRSRDVITRAEQVAVAEIASSERQAHYWTCAAAGYHMNRKDDEAVEALLWADRIAPQHVRNRPLVRNIVRRSDSRNVPPLCPLSTSILPNRSSAAGQRQIGRTSRPVGRVLSFTCVKRRPSI
jgi:hypothetical protein